jgi:hypothetical protein
MTLVDGGTRITRIHDGNNPDCFGPRANVIRRTAITVAKIATPARERGSAKKENPGSNVGGTSRGPGAIGPHKWADFENARRETHSEAGRRQPRGGAGERFCFGGFVLTGFRTDPGSRESRREFLLRARYGLP